MEEKKTKKAPKLIAEGDLKFHIILSFIIWQVFVYLLLNANFIILDNASNMNIHLKIFLANLAWIWGNCLILLIAYLFNSRHTTVQLGFKSTRRYVLIWFYLLTIGINYKFVIRCFELSRFVLIGSMILHIVIVYFVNKLLFKRFIER